MFLGLVRFPSVTFKQLVVIVHDLNKRPGIDMQM